ncbi:MAG: flavodoxin family protein [Marinifilaceae bacterium]|jgi:multimeric flavodoxin WrbA|nr:flavodoxin family protein [Marinifilaceae bacterium]
MKVVAINGSPKKEGNTYHALRLVCQELEKQSIETEIICIGNKTLRGCLACGKCAENKDEKCIIKGDDLNVWVQKMKEADGIILASPVYYASISGSMKSFLDRAFYVAGSNGSLFRHKVGTSIAAVRRSGGLPAIHDMNNYITYSEMMMPTSNYWNVIHGLSPGEVKFDKEGVQIMRILGKNMAYLLRLIENGKNMVEAPEMEEKEFMHFVR